MHSLTIKVIFALLFDTQSKTAPLPQAYAGTWTLKSFQLSCNASETQTPSALHVNPRLLTLDFESQA